MYLVGHEVVDRGREHHARAVQVVRHLKYRIKISTLLYLIVSVLRSAAGPLEMPVSVCLSELVTLIKRLQKGVWVQKLKRDLLRTYWIK